MKRRGFFFITDSLIAVSILVIVTSLLFINYDVPEEAVYIDQANSLLDFMNSVKIDTCCSGEFIDVPQEFSLLQAVTFRAGSSLSAAKEVVELVSDNGLVPSEFGWSFYIRPNALDESECYVIFSTLEENCTQELDAKVAVSSKRRVWLYVLNEETGDIGYNLDPVLVEVRMWDD